MAKEPIKPKPKKEELSAPNYGEYTLALDGYSNLLNPTDSVLRQRGGNINVYREVLRDDQVKATFEQRRLAITSKDTIVKPASDSAEDKAIAAELEENLSAINWDSIVDKMLYGVFYGYSVSEVIWGVKNGRIVIDDIKVRDRSRFKFGKKGGLFLHKQGLDYERMPEQKFWTISTGAETSDEPYGLGLAHYLYWPTYFKRNDIKFWLIFLEKFGMPTVKGSLPAGKYKDLNERKKAIEALRAISTDAVVLTPDDLPVEFLEAARSGSGSDSYRTMHKTMDLAISKVVLGQTMTTDDGSSRSQAEVHKDVRDELVKADADLICESFNNTVVKWWTEFNYGPNVTPPTVWRDIEPPEDENQRADRDNKIYNMGFKPTAEYIQEHYGEGWVERDTGQNDFDLEDEANADFAEPSVIARTRILNRTLQDALVQGSKLGAAQYEKHVAERLQTILGFLEETNDVETFKEHLNSLLTESPNPQFISSIANATAMSFAMGGNKKNAIKLIES